MLYNIIVPESSIFFYMIYNYVIMTVIYVTDVKQFIYNIILTFNTKFKNKKINKNKIEKEK